MSISVFYVSRESSFLFISLLVQGKVARFVQLLSCLDSWVVVATNEMMRYARSACPCSAIPFTMAGDDRSLRGLGMP